MSPRRLTALAQQAVGGVLHPGECVIDATVGNGHDTLFLAHQVAPDGRVFGFDVQQGAIDRAHVRLCDAGLTGLVTLLPRGHERMRESLPPDCTGRVGAVMFNLGYLPGGDKTLVTHAATTLAALDQAASLLRVGGVISLLVYRGHRGAAEEVEAVTAWLGRLGSDFQASLHDSPGPVLHLIRRDA